MLSSNSPSVRGEFVIASVSATMSDVLASESFSNEALIWFERSSEASKKVLGLAVIITS